MPKWLRSTASRHWHKPLQTVGCIFKRCQRKSRWNAVISTHCHLRFTAHAQSRSSQHPASTLSFKLTTLDHGNSGCVATAASALDPAGPPRGVAMTLVTLPPDILWVGSSWSQTFPLCSRPWSWKLQTLTHWNIPFTAYTKRASCSHPSEQQVFEYHSLPWEHL